jgi:hypothetical protein
VIGTTFALVASVPVLADASTPVSPRAMAGTTCVHRVLSGDRTLRPVRAYVIDEVRTAVEFNLPTENGTLVMQIVLTMADDITYSPMTQTKQPDESWSREFGGLDHVYKLVDSGCHIAAALDDLVPPAKARKDWQPLNLAE